MSRFTLDEDKARDWIGRVIDANEGLAEGGPGLPDGILSDYGFGVDVDYGSETWELVAGAFRAGILADAAGREDGPALSFDFVPWDGETAGYHWTLDLAGAGGLVARTAFTEMRYLGDSTGQDLGGAELALAVLQEAAEAGNQIAAGLAAYVEQEAGR